MAKKDKRKNKTGGSTARAKRKTPKNRAQRGAFTGGSQRGRRGGGASTPGGGGGGGRGGGR